RGNVLNNVIVIQDITGLCQSVSMTGKTLPILYDKILSVVCCQKQVCCAMGSRGTAPAASPCAQVHRALGALGGHRLGGQEVVNLYAQASGDAHAEFEVGATEVAELAHDDRVTCGASDALHRRHNVVDEMLSFGVGQHAAEEIARLGVVVV